MDSMLPTPAPIRKLRREIHGSWLARKIAARKYLRKVIFRSRDRLW
jgi:hypothetical protein